MSDIDDIRKRDAESGALWFTGPASFTALGARDRRALLAAYDALEAEKTEATAKLTRQKLDICDQRDKARAEVEALRGTLMMVKEAAIARRGEDFNLTREQWQVFHAALAAGERAADQPAACQHDLQEPGCTCVVHADRWGATCSVCNQVWRIRAADKPSEERT